MMRDCAVTSRIMKRIPSKNTRPEILLRKELFSRGLRYRVNVRGLPGRPDIVFPRVRLALFVDGDFWHGREWRTRGYKELKDAFKNNVEYWVSKIDGNIKRDRRNTRHLRKIGFTVLRIWASQIEKNVSSAADRVEKALHKLSNSKDEQTLGATP
jgi:DNA mismatch endonuclease, patch repair protein